MSKKLNFDWLDKFWCLHHLHCYSKRDRVGGKSTCIHCGKIKWDNMGGPGMA